MLKPLADRVILEVTKEEETTVGGIVLASNVQEKPQTGKIIAVGDGRTMRNGEKIAVAVSVGQTVLFDKYAGSEVSFEGKDYLIVHEKDIIATVD
ncbi:co-chaperone GroES [Dellaglioa algida]|uniref:co-chaperone GroES n=1 Tax=Dellaglioa algida TaxID=105612 RepID=UPI000BD6C692|nr:co-chaperone GroES [Dellaglioa algida]MDK1718764.1 co-chaperone GroES [Dellaglioa algida]MDK1730337.1 co-chaperone GroES [Dellaglioa algida]MDK1742771.1 co-chaperone GroES [Dellaglioa algida]SOB51255.1 chaperonin small subunit [Dellaglioa algida]